MTWNLDDLAWYGPHPPDFYTSGEYRKPTPSLRTYKPPDPGSKRPPGAPMRVVVPYTRVHPATRAALDRCAPHAEYVDVSASDFAYHALLTRLWAEREDLILIEHDIEVDEAIIDAFETCPRLWCCVAEAPGASWAALTCNRFRRELMVQNSALPGMGAGWPDNWNGAAQHWCGLDGFMRRNLQQIAGSTVHLHRDLLTRHHHDENKRAILAGAA